ncbi:DUF5776 domain-containing protein [Lentilactobacillus hilgardii]|uniref:DUF5776 domain-containing protein n=1 Tax=Lentilactobacillus hilgardii TaxID=1588 RepID=UPI0039E7EE3D
MLSVHKSNYFKKQSIFLILVFVVFLLGIGAGIGFSQDVFLPNKVMAATNAESIDDWMPDKSLQQLVLWQLQQDDVMVNGSLISSADQITKEMLESDQFTVLYSGDPNVQLNNKAFFEDMLNIQSLNGLQYAKNLKEINISPYMGAAIQWGVNPFQKGKLNDISALKNLDSLVSISIDMESVHDISALAGKKLDSDPTRAVSSFAYNNITDISPLKSSKDTLHDSLEVNHQAYVLPTIILNSNLKSYQMASFVTNIDGQNIPVTPYYASSSQTQYYRSYKSTANGGTATTAMPSITWTDLASGAGTTSTGQKGGFMTFIWDQPIFPGGGDFAYDGGVIQPYLLDDSVGDVNAQFVDAKTNQQLAPQQTISGKLGDSYNLSTNSNVQNEITALKSKYGYTSYTVSGSQTGTYQADSVPTVTYKFGNTPIVKKGSVTINFEDQNNHVIKDPVTKSGDAGSKFTLPDGLPASTISKDGKTYDLVGLKTGEKVPATYSDQNQSITYVYKAATGPTPGGGGSSSSTSSSSQASTSSAAGGSNSSSSVVASSSGSAGSSSQGSPVVLPDYAAKKNAVVYSLKPIYLYRHANFGKKERLAYYTKKPRVYRPMFVVTGYARSGNGQLRYEVKDVNHLSRTANKRGYITARWSYVRPVYYSKKRTRVTVINPRGIYAYSRKNLTKRGQLYRQGTILKVNGLVTHNLTTRFKLTNGKYVTANRKLVMIGKQHYARYVKTRRVISTYRNVDLTKRLKRISKGHIFRILNFDYSSQHQMTKHGLLRYRIDGGYVTANPKYVITVK